MGYRIQISRTGRWYVVLTDSFKYLTTSNLSSLSQISYMKAERISCKFNFDFNFNQFRHAKLKYNWLPVHGHQLLSRTKSKKRCPPVTIGLFQCSKWFSLPGSNQSPIETFFENYSWSRTNLNQTKYSSGTPGLPPADPPRTIIETSNVYKSCSASRILCSDAVSVCHLELFDIHVLTIDNVHVL